MYKNISVLGSTGSIGRQTLEVCGELGIKIASLACGQNIDLLLSQIVTFHPLTVSVASEASAAKLAEYINGEEFRHRFYATNEQNWNSTKLPEVLQGEEGNLTAASLTEVDCVVGAMVGFVGLKPIIAAINAGKAVALANKETLVTAGKRVLAAARAKRVPVLPLDSEHSAIWQCLQAGKPTDLKRIFLTASGGPFRLTAESDLEKVTATDALKHPTWKMGAKITIDSATLMNKGLEVIEAARLFNVDGKQIEVVVHPESIIHSMIEWQDGSVLAQLGFPDMKMPIKIALSYPERINLAPDKPFNPFVAPAASLTFMRPRRDAFPLLDLAYKALEYDGLAPTYMNAANEVAVAAFLAGKIKFTDISKLVEKIFNTCLTLSDVQEPSYDDIIEADSIARHLANKEIKQ